MVHRNPEIPACGRGRNMFTASLRTSFVVGTALTAINQWPALIAGPMVPPVLLRVVFNYLVPFLVAAYSRVALARELVGGVATGTSDA